MPRSAQELLDALNAIPRRKLPPSAPSPEDAAAFLRSVMPESVEEPDFATRALAELAAQAKQLGAGAIELAGRVPWEIGALPVAGAEFIGNKTGLSEGYPATEWMLGRAQKGTDIAEQVTGAGEPEGVAQRVMRAAPTSVTPMGPATKAATALVTGLRALMPGDLGSGSDEVSDEGPTSTDMQISDLFASAAQAEEPPREEGQPESVVVKGVDGTPTKVDPEDYTTFGILGLATVGMMFAPSLVRTVVNGRLPRLRPVANAAPGTEAMSNLGDLARTYDDVNAGALRLARRAGIAPDAVATLERNFRLLTRSAANGLGDAAVKLGIAETPYLSFRARVPLAALNRVDTPTVSQYLHLRDTLDDFLAQQNRGPKSRAPVRQVIRGLTQPDVLRQINALEAANPELRQIGTAFRENTRAMRRFMATGEYGIISQREMRRLNAEHAHEVPFPGGRNLDDPTHDRGSATVELAITMRNAIRQRLENEAVGQYIDTVRQQQPSLFTRVTPAQVAANPQWKRNIVTLYRRGVKEQYTTDPFLADVLNIDPYYFGSQAGQTIYGTKRLLETTTTGRLAPWFALTSALRSWQISKYTAAPLRSATALGSVVAIPQQLIPRFAGAIGEALDRGSGGWLTQVFGQAGVNAVSQRLTRTWTDSFAHQMERNGTIRGAVLQQQVQRQLLNARTAFQRNSAVRGVSHTLNTLGHGYMELLNAIHNAPAFNFAMRNRGRLPAPELAAAARALTGDPRIGGQYSTARGAIRFEREQGVVRDVLQRATQAYGSATELGRMAVPWFNYTVQGMKAIGAAYLRNPAAFTGRVWLYSMLPAAAGYLYNRALGPEYTDYQMNRRSNYNRTMNWYIGIPGRPPEEGIEVPVFHELSIAKRMMEVGLHHLFGDALMTPSEDWRDAAQSFMSVAIMLPTPPVMQAAAGAAGMVLPQGVFGGEAYTPQTEPFDQTGSGLPKSIELVARAFGGGLADVIGNSYAAFTQTEGSVLQGLQNAIAEGARRTATKTPIVRDVVNAHVPVSTDTQMTQEMFRKMDALDTLNAFFEKWTKEPGDTSNARVPGEINTTPASKGGGALVEALLGPGLPPTSAGLDQPEPTNPLYNLFMQEVYTRFHKDAPDAGGQGFQTLWRRWGDYSENLRRMRNINAGNMTRWQQQMSQRPEEIDLLTKAGVDWKDPTAVRNWYTKQRQDVGAVILFTIRQVEEDLSKRLGRPVKLEDLAPYGAPSGLDEAPSLPEQ